MTSLTLDGGTVFRGTEFIKFEITGSSNLATEDYVLQQVALGGGGGTSNTDLSGYYNLTQTNSLLDTKLNINNPQDISGVMRLGHLDGLSKIILNADGSNGKDFYVNGDAQVLGNLTVLSLDSTGYIKVDSIQSNTYNTLNTDDILFQSNGVSYAQFDYSEDLLRFIKDVRFTNLKGNFISNYDSNTDLKFQINSNDFITLNATNNKIEIDRDVEIHSANLKTNVLDSWTDTDLQIKRNGVNFFELKTDNRIIANQLIQCGGNLKTQEIDTIAPLDMILKVGGIDFLELKADDRIVASKLIQCGANLKTQEIDTIAPLDLVIKRGGVTEIEVKDNETQFNCDISLNGFTVKSNAFDTTGDVSMELRRNNDPYITLETDDTISIPKVATFSNNVLCNNIITCDTFDSKAGSTISNYIMNDNTGQIKFYVGSPTVPDATTNLVMTLQNNLITFHKPTSPEIGGGTIDDSNYVKKTGETSQLIVSETYFQGTTLQSFRFSLGGPQQFAQYKKFEIYNSEILAYTPFKCVNNLGLQTNVINSFTNVDLVFQRNNTDILQFNTSNQLQFLQGAQKSYMYEEEFVDVTTINAFRIRNTENVNTSHISFGVGDVLDVFQIFKTGLASTVELTIPQVLCNSFDSFGDNSVSFKRNGIEYMNFNGALSSVDVNASLGVRSNIYNSIGNVDVAFRRNSIDFFYLRNGQVETNTGVSLSSTDAKLNNINTTGDTNMILSRNGVEYFRLATGYSTSGGAPTNIIDVSNTVGVSSSWLFGNAFANRSVDTDTEFLGAVSAGSAWGKLYMKYEHSIDNLHLYSDVELEQNKVLYIHKETSKNSWITSTNTAGVNHTSIINQDPNGDVRIFADGGVRLYVTPSKVSVPPPYTLEGDVVDTSQKSMKYDIEEANFNFTEIVNSIKPKTFKMKEEKELGITKTHIGFIAEDAEKVIPEKVENIVMEVDGIKKLSYIKLNTVLWGAVREVVKENEEMKNRIEHLESRLFEVENFIKDFNKPKPKSKAKAKSKE